VAQNSRVVTPLKLKVGGRPSRDVLAHLCAAQAARADARHVFDCGYVNAVRLQIVIEGARGAARRCPSQWKHGRGVRGSLSRRSSRRFKTVIVASSVCLLKIRVHVSTRCRRMNDQGEVPVLTPERVPQFAASSARRIVGLDGLHPAFYLLNFPLDVHAALWLLTS